MGDFINCTFLYFMFSSSNMSTILFSFLFLHMSFYFSSDDKQTYRLSETQTNSLTLVILDTAEIDVFYYRNPFDKIENPKKVYFYWDSVQLENGITGFGKITFDPLQEYNNRFFGEWHWYYTGGVLMAKGTYAIGAYVFCSADGPHPKSYSYPTGKWFLFHQNGKSMTTGEFEKELIDVHTNCGADKMIQARFNLVSSLLDEHGSVVRNNPNFSKVLSVITQWK